jgi:hypothetical protein
MFLFWIFSLIVPGFGDIDTSNDDVISVLHLATHNSRSVVDVSFAAFTTAADRSEQLVRLALQEVRRTRIGKSRKVMTGNDILSVAVRKFVTSTTDEPTGDFFQATPQQKETLAFVAGGMDLLLLFVSYIAYPRFHCQPILILYWWISGTAILMGSQGLEMNTAFLMLAQISTTIGYGTSTPTTPGLKFYHAVHAFTGLTAGVGDALDSIADYLIVAVDGIFGAAHSDSRDSAFAKGCTDHYSHEMKKNVHTKYSKHSLYAEEVAGEVSVAQIRREKPPEVSDASWEVDEKVQSDDDPEHGWQDHYTEMATVQCSREILQRRIQFRVLSLVVFSFLTTCYLLIDFQSNKTTEVNGSVGKGTVMMNYGQQLGNAMYTTIITFTTVGYGDINPYGRIARFVSPVVLHAVVHDFGLFQSVIFQYNHDKPNEAWAPDGLDYQGGADVDHHSRDHDMGVTNCPMFKKQYPNFAVANGANAIQSYSEAEKEANALSKEAAAHAAHVKLHSKIDHDFEDPFDDEASDWMIADLQKEMLRKDLCGDAKCADDETCVENSCTKKEDKKVEEVQQQVNDNTEDKKIEGPCTLKQAGDKCFTLGNEDGTEDGKCNGPDGECEKAELDQQALVEKDTSQIRNDQVELKNDEVIVDKEDKEVIDDKEDSEIIDEKKDDLQQNQELLDSQQYDSKSN